MYRSFFLADNSHQGLQRRLNTWLRKAKPDRIHSVRMTADGAEFTYCVLVLYVVSEKSEDRQGAG